MDIDADTAQFLEWLFDGSLLSPETAAFEYAQKANEHYFLSEVDLNDLDDHGIDAWECDMLDDVVHTKKRRRTELDRLHRNGWERVQDKVCDGEKRRRFAYVGPDGRKQTSLKAAMKAIRADCAKATNA